MRNTMKTQNHPIPTEELLSALVDGELDAASCADALRPSQCGAEVAEQWRTYHLIGGTLRANSIQAAAKGYAGDALFMSRLSQRLAVEKIAPAQQPLLVMPSDPVVRPNLAVKQAANDGNVRWKMLAGVACMGTVAALAWSVSGFGASDAARQMVLAVPSMLQGQVVVGSAQGPMVRDVRLEELLAAHKQMGGTSLPVPTGFLRNANFENQTGAGR
jgi:sigma-E factor negative regulatory protein RseA